MTYSTVMDGFLQLLRWKTKCRNMATTNKELASSLLEAVQVCDAAYYPNISSILNLLLALPVGSCACERSFSSLRRLKTWSRSTIGEQRLNGLSLLFVHRDSVSELDRLNILRRWDSDPHRITLVVIQDLFFVLTTWHSDTLSVIKLSCLTQAVTGLV